MYSAEQIRKKVYIPIGRSNELDLEDVNALIVSADAQNKNSIKVRKDCLWSNTIEFVKAYGYNVESVEFLGTKFWQISW